MRVLSNDDGVDRGADSPLQMNASATRLSRRSSLADVTLLPIYILWFIWRLQFVARWTWVFFVVWIVVSFAVHRDSPKMLGWRADNLIPASKQAVFFFGVMTAGLVAIGLALSARVDTLPRLFSWSRFGGYLAFCLLQQVALNSLVHNHMMSLVRNEYVAAALTGIIFAACHWPNPVLVPLTLIGGAVMAWMFGRVRNIIPLAIGQAILGSLVFWAFPIAWQHHLRVGPGFYAPFR